MIGIRGAGAGRNSATTESIVSASRSKISFTTKRTVAVVVRQAIGFTVTATTSTFNGFIGVKFRGAKSVCGPCILRERCLKTPETTETKQVTIFIGRSDETKDSPIEKMKRKFDTLFGRFMYNKRIAIVEPVFGNLKNKGMDRFTLGGKKKVNTQWQLFGLVHNIEKIAHVGAV